MMGHAPAHRAPPACLLLPSLNESIFILFAQTNASKLNQQFTCCFSAAPYLVKNFFLLCHKILVVVYVLVQTNNFIQI